MTPVAGCNGFSWTNCIHDYPHVLCISVLCNMYMYIYIHVTGMLQSGCRRIFIVSLIGSPSAKWEAIPSWRVFIFGGSADRHGEGRSMGRYESLPASKWATTTRMLSLHFTWSAHDFCLCVENAALCSWPRVHCIVYIVVGVKSALDSRGSCGFSPDNCNHVFRWANQLWL